MIKKYMVIYPQLAPYSEVIIKGKFKIWYSRQTVWIYDDSGKSNEYCNHSSQIVERVRGRIRYNYDFSKNIFSVDL